MRTMAAQADLSDATGRGAPHWIKRGRIFDPAGAASWITSHAALPAALHLNADRYRVYFSSRDGQNRSRIGYVEIELRETCRIRCFGERPVVDVGPLGAFDDSGVTTGCVVQHDGRIHLYYTGWMLGRTVPFYYAVGLAISEDGGRTFEKASAAPLLDRCDVDPYLVASPYLLVEGGLWRMWYVSGVRWAPTPHGPRHYYHIRYAESADGLHWKRTGRVCIDFAAADEHAIARPTVVKDGDRYRMWFPHRGADYRIGYAESPDGLTWRRMDDRAGIDVTPSAWDGDMQAYPHVFDHAGRRYMLYNGNGYGATGIGLAEWSHPVEE
ncbi:MAG: hypothetical protein V3T70_09680 [Phycisphaerae bacterium]